MAPAATAQHLSNLWEDPSVGKGDIFGRGGGEGGLLPDLMPAPRRFLVASTSLPLALGWGWNLSLYVGMLLGLLTLMLLLLWVLIKQLSNSVGKATLQPVRSLRQPRFEQRRQHLPWKYGTILPKLSLDWGLLECFNVLLQICVRKWFFLFLFLTQVLIFPNEIIKMLMMLLIETTVYSFSSFHSRHAWSGDVQKDHYLMRFVFISQINVHSRAQTSAK